MSELRRHLNVRKIMSFSWNLIENITKNSDEKLSESWFEQRYSGYLNQVCLLSLLWIFSPIYFNSRWFLFMSPTAKNWSLFSREKTWTAFKIFNLFACVLCPFFFGLIMLGWLINSMNFIDMSIKIKTKLIFSFFIELICVAFWKFLWIVLRMIDWRGVILIPFQ